MADIRLVYLYSHAMRTVCACFMARTCLFYINKYRFPIGDDREPSWQSYPKGKRMWSLGGGGPILEDPDSDFQIAGNWFFRFISKLWCKIVTYPDIGELFTQESQLTLYTTPYPTGCNYLNVVKLLKMMEIQGNPAWFELHGLPVPGGVRGFAGLVEILLQEL